MNKFIIRNYFMVRGEHFVLSILLRFYSNINYFKGFRHTQCWLTWVGLSHLPSVSTVVCLGSSLTQTTSPTILLSRFPFLSTYSDVASSPCRFWNCLSTSYWEFGFILFKDCITVRYSESDLIFLSLAIYLLLITVLF